LAPIEAHLKLRNFLVGHSLTIADALLINWLSSVFAIALEKRVRDKDLPNIVRYVAIISAMPLFVDVYGQPVFCKDTTFKPATAAAPADKAKAAPADKEKKAVVEKAKWYDNIVT